MTVYAGQRLTAAIVNGITGVVAACKAVDKTINNSTAPSNDSELVLPMVANAVYEWESALFYSAATAADGKVTLTGPAGATATIAVLGLGISAVNNFDAQVTSTVALGAPYDLGGIGTGSANKVCARSTGTVRTSVTAGNLQLQWCQRVANVSDAVLYADSWMRLTRVS